MRFPLILVCVLLAAPLSAQVSVQRPLISTRVQAVHVQNPQAVLKGETAEMCVARNQYLRQKMTPALQAQLAELQSQIADRRAQSFVCSADLGHSISGNGASSDCGVYACNPLDGLCRSWAKTTDDCAMGYLWDGFRSCVPAPR